MTTLNDYVSRAHREQLLRDADDYRRNVARHHAVRRGAWRRRGKR